MARNGWTASIGIDGRHGPDYADPQGYQFVERIGRRNVVAERLQVSLSFAYSIMQRGDIPTVRLGRAVRIRPEDLEEFIRSNVRNAKPS